MNYFKNICIRLCMLFVALQLIATQTTGQVRIKEIDSVFLHAQGDPLKYPDSAWNLSEEIRILSHELSYEWGLLQSNLIKGMTLYQKNELDSAAKALIETVAKAENLRPASFEEARARTYLGFIYRRLGNLDKAMQNFERSAKIFEFLEEHSHYAANLNNIGIIHGSRGEYPEALEIFLKVRDIALSGRLPEEQGLKRLSRALTNTSSVYSEMGNHELALSFAMQGLEIKSEMGDFIGMGYSYLAIGDIFGSSNRLDSALVYHNLCIEKMADNTPRSIPIILQAKQRMAEIYAEKGDLPQAIQVLTSSMGLRVKNENYELDNAYNLISLYHMRLSQYDSSKFYANKALRMAIANDNKTAARDAAEQLSEAFQRLNQFDSAYYYQSLGHRYNDSIFNKETLRKYNNLRIEFETAEKQKEIKVLEKQTEIDEKNQTLLIVSIIAIIILSTALAIFLVYRHRNRQLILQTELEKGEQALQQQTLHMMNLTNHISDIERRLKSMKKRPSVEGKEVQGVLNNIFVNKSMEKEWLQLERHFSKIHPNFNTQIMRRHENLTQRERRLLALIKLDLNTREISGILCIEQRSVVMSRYRLKRKLGLEEKVDLDTYVQTF